MDNIEVMHNSHSLKYRKPFGGIKLNEKLELGIFVSETAQVSVEIEKFNGKKETYEMKPKDKNFYFIEIDIGSHIGVVNYYFKIISDQTIYYYGNNEDLLGGLGRVYTYIPNNRYQITVYKEQIVPKWYKEGIIYQIFVDRFYNGNDEKRILDRKKNSFIYANWDDKPMYIKDCDGRILRWDFYGGNLQGIISKLDYLTELGVSVIYMNPIFESSSCHKYDTGDYEKIDNMFGDEEVLRRLCSEAKKRGIYIILDGVFSHTGADSKYFNKYDSYKEIGAYQGKQSRYYSWYKFEDFPDRYECWWGIDNQPNVNELNESYLDYIITGNSSIIKKWMDCGVYGWRLDVADELPDEFIKILRKKVKEINPNGILIGEVWEDASNKISYGKKREYFFGDELDSVTNYPLRETIIDCILKRISVDIFVQRVMSQYENYPSENYFSSMNLLGNHDTERILTKLGNNFQKLKLATLIQVTLPGVPLIYYGDEVGVVGGKDPENRSTFPWGNENITIFDWYKRILKIRSNEEALKGGKFEFLSTEDKEILCYRRIGYSSVIVYINLSDNKKTIKLNKNKKYKILISTNEIEVINKSEIYIYGNNGIIVKEL